MTTISRESVLALITEAGLNPNDVTTIEIDNTGAVFTLFVKIPSDVEADRQILVHEDSPMFYRKKIDYTGEGAHVHEDGEDHA